MGFQYEEFYFSMTLRWFSIFYWFPFWSIGYLRVCFLIFDRFRWFVTLFFSPKFIGFRSDYLVCTFSPFNLYSFYMPRKMILCFVFYEYNKKKKTHFILHLRDLKFYICMWVHVQDYRFFKLISYILFSYSIPAVITKYYGLSRLWTVKIYFSHFLSLEALRQGVSMVRWG